MNPGGGQTNCGLVACQVDIALGGGTPQAADPHGLPMTASQVQAMAGGGPWVDTSGLSNVVRRVRDWGHGSRGIVMGLPVAGIGHFFNVVNDRGAVVFIDGQQGQAGPDSIQWRYYKLMKTR
ncbi:toxin glutamine deamidase domain-containing protein [Actinoplanes sp. DH11]|uniref:toxin glutamine deamidase domain-containing protein n=1 Tax=Actinoplanes sp. DH11 TaxID=2857011 RepID=UPI0035B49037